MLGGRFGDYSGSSAFTGDGPQISKEKAGKDKYDIKRIMETYIRKQSNNDYEGCKDARVEWEKEKENKRFAVYETRKIFDQVKNDSMRLSEKTEAIGSSNISEGEALEEYEKRQGQHMIGHMQLLLDTIKKYL